VILPRFICFQFDPEVRELSPIHAMLFALRLAGSYRFVQLHGNRIDPLTLHDSYAMTLHLYQSTRLARHVQTGHILWCANNRG
jgi:hypothetical protein